MYTSPFSGTCNRCGLCCQEVDRNGTRWVCEHLEVSDVWGHPHATRCRVYLDRYDGMPIVLMSLSGTARTAFCPLNSPWEDQAILERGIGKGCSLEVR